MQQYHGSSAFLVKSIFLDYNMHMKFLIIATETDGTTKFAEFLESKGCSVEISTLNEDNTLLFSKIKNADNYILLDSDRLMDNGIFLFMLGRISERGHFAIFQGKNAENLKPYNPENADFFYTEKKADAMKTLKENFKAYFDADKKRTALNDLLSRGLPFNADCMAHFIEKDKPEIVELVYEAGLDLNSFTEEGVPVLCAATRCGNFEYVKWLLKRNADVNIISKDRGYSPVMDAVWKKNLEMVKLYIKAGADLNIMSRDGQPILVLAVGNGNAKIVEALLKAGADPDVQDGMGMSARSYANLFKNADLIKIMNKFPKKE